MDAFIAVHGLSKGIARQLRCTAEHLQAKQDGGRDRKGNIAAVCYYCNHLRHKGRSDVAPALAAYKAHVVKRMAKGRW